VPSTPPVVLTIAGFDPSCGAGVTADIKTIAAHQCYGVACITALTVQSTAGVGRVEPVSPRLVSETLEELASDLEIAAVHIGMLASEGIIEAVASFLAERKLPNIVLDPVIRSSSGASLLSESGIRSLVAKLLPLAAIVTPNVDEAAILTGLPTGNPEQVRQAAARLHGLGSTAVVVTGGHLEQAVDVLSIASGDRPEVFPAEKLQSNSTHGTGCAFATALACNLAQRRNLAEAVRLAKAYVTAAIRHGYPLGRGTGPVNHLYGMRKAGTTIPDAGAGNTSGTG
jgi:hydroxymethylpyrimidine/phosphomethylpyrimidine kinase